MFGEKPMDNEKAIIGINNDKIILPSFTNAEPGDKVSATLDPYQKKIILLQERELIERLNILHGKMQLAYQEGRLKAKDYHDLQRYFWGMLPLHERTLNKKLEYQLFNRKPVASLELKQIQRITFGESVFAVGVCTTLEIYPDEQSYHDYQTMEEQRRLLKQPK